MAQVTRSVREAVYQVAQGKAVTHSEHTLSECVTAGLLELDHGEYIPTVEGFFLANEQARAVEKERGAERRVRRYEASAFAAATSWA